MANVNNILSSNLINTGSISVSFTPSVWDGTGLYSGYAFDTFDGPKYTLGDGTGGTYNEQGVVYAVNTYWQNLIGHPTITGQPTTSTVVIFKAALNTFTFPTTDLVHPGETKTFKAWTHPDTYYGSYALQQSIVLGVNQDLSTANGINTVVHELGHFYGLDHPTVEVDQRQSVMSSTPYQGTSVFDAVKYAITPMALDIAAIQSTYGASTVNDGNNTVYSTASFSTSHYSFSTANAMQTIWDAGGTGDIFNLSNFASDLRIDLREAVDSSGNWHDYHTVTGSEWTYIARGSVIENAIGGSGNDLIYGNDSSNNINGGGGKDTIVFTGNFGDDIVSNGETLLIGEGAKQRVLHGEAKNDGNGHYHLQTGEAVDKIDSHTLVIYSGNNSITISDWAADAAHNYGITLAPGSVPDPLTGLGTSTLGGGDVGDPLHGSVGSGQGVTPTTEVTGAWVKYVYEFHQVDIAGTPAEWIAAGSSRAEKEGAIETAATHYASGDSTKLSIGDTFVVNSVAALVDALPGKFDGYQEDQWVYNPAIHDYETVPGQAVQHEMYITARVVDIVTASGFTTTTSTDPFSGRISVVPVPWDPNTVAYMTRYEQDSYKWVQSNAVMVDLNNDGHDDYGSSARGIDWIYGTGSEVLNGTASDDYLTNGRIMSGGAGFNTYGFFGDYLPATIQLANGASGAIEINGTILGGTWSLSTGHAATFVATNEWALDGHELNLDGTTLYIHSDTQITVTDFTSGDLGIFLTGAAVMGTTGNDSLVGTAFDEVMSGGDGNDSMTGLGGNDSLTGGIGNDSITGGAGNDTLDGGTGNDSMLGGTGNDTYYLDIYTDTITESANEGIDSVISSTNYTLAANLENLTLTGTAILNGSGNALANIVFGNDSINTLYGYDGNDSMHGGAGNDNIFGGDGNDLLYGDAGVDAIHGDAGNNTMIGGLGDDVYYVDSIGDVILESSGEGSEWVYTSVSYTLPDNVENLAMVGTGDIEGTGNELTNYLMGNGGNNILTGSAGADTLSGGNGNDTLYGVDGNDNLVGGTGADSMLGGLGDDQYNVDNTGDTVVESASAGSDWVTSSISWTLGSNIENLILSGTANINGDGNGLNNTILANSGNNVLTAGAGNDAVYGYGGNDTLIGGSGIDTFYGSTGADVFLYNSLSDSGNASGSRDIIADFSSTESDKIDLSAFAGTFSFVGTSSFSGTTNEINYATVTGNTIISIDSDGNGTSDMQIQLVGARTMTASDFVL